jgi:DNA-directed RNA polymerase subunit omega
MLPSPDILNEFTHGKFVLSNLAAKRAKQLQEGAPAMVHIESRHPLTIALAEIAAGKVKAIMGGKVDGIVEAGDVAVLVGETVPAELGMLLPALDEIEVALVTNDEALLVEDDHDEVIAEDDLMSLSDLVSEEEEAEVGSSEDSDTLSLSALEEQETIEEEGGSADL